MNNEMKNELTDPQRVDQMKPESREITWGTPKDWILVAALAVPGGFITALPHYMGWDVEAYYMRNGGFIFLPMMILYFALKQSMKPLKVLGLLSIVGISALFINLLPDEEGKDTLLLAGIHLPLMIWALLGYAFTGDEFGSTGKRIAFLRFNGDLAVLTGVICIAGAVLSGLTIGLFSLIDMNIEDFYMRNLATWGVAAAPVIGMHIVRTNPQLVSNVSPVIARIFTPLVLIMLVIYLAAMVISGKDPYNDREFLLIFNLLLVGVMALILFSVAESSKSPVGRAGFLMLFLLSLVTVVVNGIALSAIIFRISEWGITPNRLAVLGANLLILTNLLMVTFRFFQSLRHPEARPSIEKAIGGYLPVYAVWTAVVAFVFPLIW